MNIRYSIARQLMHLGLWIMPDSRYKRELLEVLWKLYFKVHNHNKELDDET